MRIKCTNFCSHSFTFDVSVVHCPGGYFFPDTVYRPSYISTLHKCLWSVCLCVGQSVYVCGHSVCLTEITAFGQLFCPSKFTVVHVLYCVQ